MIDSALPTAELLRRFRMGIPPAARLSGGAVSRAALVASLRAAVARRDTAALARLVLSRAEFAWLYYPETPLAHPPYELDPGFMWFQFVGRNRRGVRQLLGLADRGFRIQDVRCRHSRSDGPNHVLQDCYVLVQAPAGQTDTAAVVGSLLERAGRLKFVSYSSGS